MNTEDLLFKTFSEAILLHELYEKLTPEQAMSIVEDLVASFSHLPAPVIEKYKLFLKSLIKSEETRGAVERASILEDLLLSFQEN